MIAEPPIPPCINANPSIPADVCRMERTETGWKIDNLRMSTETYVGLAAIAREHTAEFSISEAIAYLVGFHNAG